MEVDFSATVANKVVHQKWIKVCAKIDVTDVFIDEVLIEKEQWTDYGFV